MKKLNRRKKIHDCLTSSKLIKPKGIPLRELDMHLTRFSMNAKKVNEPDTLQSSRGSVNHYLADKKLKNNIITVFLGKRYKKLK